MLEKSSGVEKLRKIGCVVRNPYSRVQLHLNGDYSLLITLFETIPFSMDS
jgi:hypothetical protein